MENLITVLLGNNLINTFDEIKILVKLDIISIGLSENKVAD